jgi:hypothetical protein
VTPGFVLEGELRVQLLQLRRRQRLLLLLLMPPGELASCKKKKRTVALPLEEQALSY